ncbi:MAG TPA: methyltransferase domain-containing protein [bacterium]|nr:methyltransferase domain-containing protein [bacterium]HPP87120.1 methyltransferase domain-containing protein [bacterium]
MLNFTIHNFSKNAKYYDNAAIIQNSIIDKMLPLLKNQNFDYILEFGCGTGNYTKKIIETCAFKKILAIDISNEMLTIAKSKIFDNRIFFLQCDASEIDRQNIFNIEKFDLITSNAALQWINDKHNLLKKIKILLKNNGKFIFSIFGNNTFAELNRVIKKFFSDENINIASHYFLDKSALSQILQENFSNVLISDFFINYHYENLMDLLKSIKYTGTGGEPLIKNKMFTKKKIDELEKLYFENFGKITATYQFFICVCEK